jgi:uncharacterized UPF0160 family protein
MKVKINKLITHNGTFHADDIFAAAALSIYLKQKGEEFEIVRTRDEEVIKIGDYVFDVGGIYDEEKNLFDHHQTGGAGIGPYGVDYSSLGLVWKKFGKEIAGGEKAARIIEKKLCAPIDAADNGIDIAQIKGEIAPYYIQNVFYAMLPTWKEEGEDIDKIFLKCVELAKMILKREITQAQDMVEAETAIISAYENSADKRIVVLDKNYPFEYILFGFPEPLFAVYPRKTGDAWGVKAIRKDLKTFHNRKDFPVAWAGLRDEALQKISGVDDAIFCHRSLFFAGAKSREGAVQLAKIAVEAQN